jgi:hypothetical protein
MKAPWNKRRLSENERQQWMVTARLFGVALGLAVIVIWAFLRKAA